jgi:hypothetical protein
MNLEKKLYYKYYIKLLLYLLSNPPFIQVLLCKLANICMHTLQINTNTIQLKSFT